MSPFKEMEAFWTIIFPEGTHPWGTYSPQHKVWGMVADGELCDESFYKTLDVLIEEVANGADTENRRSGGDRLF